MPLGPSVPDPLTTTVALVSPRGHREIRGHEALAPGLDPSPVSLCPMSPLRNQK